MTLIDLKVIQLIQTFSNATFRTVLQHLRKFQLTYSLARSLSDNWSSCSWPWCAQLVI